MRACRQGCHNSKETLPRATSRSSEINASVASGQPYHFLGISQRTVENHPTAVMKKTGSHSLSALIRLALAADPDTGSETPR